MKRLVRSVVPLLLTALFLAWAYGGCGDSRGGGGQAQGEEGFDLIVSGGRVIDPESGRDEVATVGVRGGVIRAVVPGDGADLPRAPGATVIDASGLVVAPGFINTHTHETNLTGSNQVKESGKAFVQDGVTFWLGGNCGLSATGVRLKFGDVVLDNLMGLSLAEYLEDADRQGLYNHYGTLTGHISLRGDAGCEHGQPESDQQIEHMVQALREELDAGSFGISYGPFYDPGSTTKAMIALAAESRARGGMAAIHTRNPTFNLWNVLVPGWGEAPGPNWILFGDSITEAIDICRQSGAPLIVSHLTDMAYNGSTLWTLDHVEGAIRGEGLPVAADVIGYDTFMNDFFALTRFGEIPVRLLMIFAGVEPSQFWMAEDVFVDGQLYMAAYERMQTVEQAETLAEAFREGRAAAGPDSMSISVGVWCNIVSPESTKLALKRPFVFMGSDGGVSRNPKTGALSVQPRSYACFSRLLGHWSRQEGAISLEQALFKATIAPALWLGLDRKGRIQEGCDADITIFDPDAIIDRAQAAPGMLDLPPDGIAYVLVAGQVVVDHGQLTGRTPGRVVRRTWQVPGDTGAVLDLYGRRFP